VNRLIYVTVYFWCPTPRCPFLRPFFYAASPSLPPFIFSPRFPAGWGRLLPPPPPRVSGYFGSFCSAYSLLVPFGCRRCFFTPPSPSPSPCPALVSRMTFFFFFGFSVRAFASTRRCSSVTPQFGFSRTTQFLLHPPDPSEGGVWPLL